MVKKQDERVASAGGEMDFLKVPEVCRLLNLSRSTVYGLMDGGHITFVKFGSSRRVPRTAVEEYVRRSTVPARV